MSTLRVDNVTDLGDDPVVTAGVVAGGALPAGSILQVVSVEKTDVFTTTATSFVDVTGLSVSITPSSASSKIFVSGVITGAGIAGTNNGQARFVRDSTPIFVGDAAGSRTQGLNRLQPWDAGTAMSIPVSGLDSPATTSTITYKFQVHTGGGSTVYVNRSSADSDNAAHQRTVSTITLMEVAG